MYYFGSGANDPAISRKITETELIEQHHWLPQDIANIPYKRLQEHFLILRQKNMVKQTQANVQKFKQQNSGGAVVGKTKKTYREV